MPISAKIPYAARSLSPGSKTSKSLADAVRVQTLGELTYPILCTYVDDIVTVSEQEIIAATLLAVEEAHVLLEPSGSLDLAAALMYASQLEDGKPAVVIASGGNTTLEALYQMYGKV
jgi:threonine dehydratase